MIISELIKKLTQIQREHGDIEVEVLSPDRTCDGDYSGVEAHITLEQNEENDIISVCLVDKETASAFDIV